MDLAGLAADLVVIAVKGAAPTPVERWLAAYRPIVDTAGGSLWAVEGSGDGRGPGPGHTHTTLLPAPDLEGYERSVAAARTSGRLPVGHAEIRRDVWQPRRSIRAEGAAGPVTALILAEVLCTDPEREAEWDSWYDGQHLPDMMASGAFAAGSRWYRTPTRPGGTNHLTIYEIAGIDLEEAVARSAAILPEIAATGRSHECHTGGPTLKVRRVR